MKQSPMLGVLGGMGPEATYLFYQRVVELTDADTDQQHPPALILSDTQMPDRTAAILGDGRSLVRQRLYDDAKRLQDFGCTVVAIPCNTSHYFVPQIQQQLDIPILNMIELTADALTAANAKKVGILATDGTVQTGLYQRALEQRGIEWCVPDEAGQAAIMSLIYDDIKGGKPGRPEKFERAVQPLNKQNCGCVILACTELSVYRTQQSLPAVYVDALEILAQQSVLACGKKLRRAAE